MRSILLCLLVGLICSLPSNFDLRVQPGRAQFTNYDLEPEGICAGYAWAKQIAQIVSNAVGLFEEQKIKLSAQQILDCTQTDTDVCYQATLDNIRDAIKIVTKNGLTTEECYPNRPFSFPHNFCRRQCHDGTHFPFEYFPKFTQYTNFKDIINVFKNNEDVAVLAVIKVDQAYNFYNAFNPMLTKGGPSSIYEYRVAEVLGWKDYTKSLKVILRAGPGELWGFNGFIDLQLSAFGKYIQEFYTIEISDESNLQTY